MAGPLNKNFILFAASLTQREIMSLLGVRDGEIETKHNGDKVEQTGENKQEYNTFFF